MAAIYAAPTAFPAAGSMRLTRRGRAVVTAGVALLALLVVVPGSWRAVADAQTTGPSTTTVTVQPGDTLWGIAAAARPGDDPRQLIAEIRQMNGLADAGLVPGQVLTLPVD